jgi:hypothetical protein
VNEHIGHLIDLDELDHTRLDEFIAGVDALSAADMSNRRTHEAGYNDVVTRTILDYFRARRGELVERLEELSDEQIARSAMHPRLQKPMRLVDWTYFVAEHDDHHVARIRELIEGSAFGLPFLTHSAIETDGRALVAGTATPMLARSR